MANTNKLLISRRRVEFFVLRRRFKFEQFCERCAEETRFVALEDAMLYSGLTMRELVRQADAGEIHFLESLGGHLVVCEKSLPGKVSASIENYINSGVQENVEQ